MFTDALRQNRLSPRVGDIHFLYQPSLMIGEARGSRIPDSLSSLFLVGGLGCGLVAILLLVTSPSTLNLASAAVLAAVCAFLLLLSTRREGRFRVKRRFILNFATESLRIDRPRSVLNRPQTETVPFDAVQALEVIASESHDTLVVTFRAELETDAVHTEVLIDRVLPSDTEELRKTWRFLQAAFGLTPAPTPPEPAGG